jgi:retron-type reverse transcriptase
MAKQYDGLFGELTSFFNLFLAYRKAARGKRSQAAVAAFEFDLEGRLLQLQRELREQTYLPGPYRSFYIQEAKRRWVSAAPFRDRVVHHALCNVIEPLFERTFIGDSYANRVGKGTHRALDRAQHLAQGHRYVLQCDIVQFFPSVDHAILRSILARKIADAGVLWLIDGILASGEGVLAQEYELAYFPGDDLFAVQRPRGLPIGNLTSQFWANVYLNELDQFVKRELRCRAYVRYVDDFLLFGENKRQLWAWKDAVRRFLRGLRLLVHERQSTVYPVTNGIPFLGFRLYPTHRRLRRRNGVAFARRLRTWYGAVANGEMSVAELHAHVQGWIAHAEHGDTWGLRRALLSRPIPRGAA